jgi:hypothetical protein
MFWIIIAGALPIFVVIYWKYVPSIHGHLDSFAHISPSKVPYPADIWPDHHYVDLPNGVCHYYYLGPKSGKRVVVVHGINITCIGMSRLLKSLAESGHRVLAYGTHYIVVLSVIRFIW